MGPRRPVNESRTSSIPYSALRITRRNSFIRLFPVPKQFTQYRSPAGSRDTRYLTRSSSAKCWIDKGVPLRRTKDARAIAVEDVPYTRLQPLDLYPETSTIRQYTFMLTKSHTVVIDTLQFILRSLWNALQKFPDNWN